MPEIKHALNRSLVITGYIDKQTSKNLHGYIHPSGTLSSLKLIIVYINHALSFIRSLNKQASVSNIGSLTLTGELNKQAMTTISRDLSLASELIHRKNPEESVIRRVGNWIRRSHH